jgi:hypothetical protein
MRVPVSIYCRVNVINVLTYDEYDGYSGLMGCTKCDYQAPVDLTSHSQKAVTAHKISENRGAPWGSCTFIDIHVDHHQLVKAITSSSRRDIMMREKMFLTITTV